MSDSVQVTAMWQASCDACGWHTAPSTPHDAVREWARLHRATCPLKVARSPFSMPCGWVGYDLNKHVRSHTSKGESPDCGHCLTCGGSGGFYDSEVFDFPCPTCGAAARRLGLNT